MDQEWKRGRFLNYFMGLVGALVFAIGIFTDEPLWDDLGAAGIGILGSAIGLHLFFFRIPKGRLNEEQKLKLERRQTVLYTTYFGYSLQCLFAFVWQLSFQKSILLGS